MNVSSILKSIETGFRNRSPEILSGLGVVGVIYTSYLSAKASFKASDIIRLSENSGRTYDSKKEQFKERVYLVWKFYIPTAVSGTITIGSIVYASKIENKRAAAIAAAYSVTEKAFSEYRERVVEEFGVRKDKSIRDKVAKQRVKDNSVTDSPVVVIGSKEVLCYEMHTGRYFTSDMETLRKAQNDINARILTHDIATLADFHYILGLPITSQGNVLGWKSPKQLKLEFSTVLSEDNRPCIAFEYNNLEIV